MALLKLDERKAIFKALGLGEYNEANIKAFQKKYLLRKKDYDGIYGTNTDNALRTVYYTKIYTKNFDAKEFRCECGGRYCSGYPDYMKPAELIHIQKIRDHYGKPITITCGLRDKKYNASLGGSVQNSLHLKGQALDFYQSGVTDTLANRKKAIKWIKKQANHHYTYGNGINSNGYYVNAPYMGNALHTDTYDNVKPKHPTLKKSNKGTTAPKPQKKPSAPKEEPKKETIKVPSLTLTKTNQQVIDDAVRWAVWIAGDNRFHYGHGTHAHHNGCHFCDTNKKFKKGHGIKEWEYTACCNPFVGSAWAHGGCVPVALKLCRDCKSWDFGTGVGSYATSSLFKSVGNARKIALKKGDVICTPSHVMLYIGAGKVVHAGYEDDNVKGSAKWNKSICVEKLTDTWHYRAGQTMRTYRFIGKVNAKMPIRYGECSYRVKQLQECLGIKADGLYGDSTLKAVKSFKKKHGLNSTGTVAEKTIEAMKKVNK